MGLLTNPVDSVIIRFPNFMITEKELRTAMSTVPEKLLTAIVDWTVAIDSRRAPATIGFFVELAHDQGASFQVFILLRRGSYSRNVVTIECLYTLGTRPPVIRQADHPARQAGDV